MLAADHALLDADPWFGAVPAERRALLQVLQRHEWNLSGVARELDISRNTLYRKLQRLNIKSSNGAHA